jgi:hypothetical protein
MKSEFENTFSIKGLNFCQHIFLAHKQLQIKLKTRILACQSRFAECEQFQKNLLIFHIAAKRRKKHKSKESWPSFQPIGFTAWLPARRAYSSESGRTRLWFVMVAGVETQNSEARNQ